MTPNLAIETFCVLLVTVVDGRESGQVKGMRGQTETDEHKRRNADVAAHDAVDFSRSRRALVLEYGKLTLTKSLEDV